MNSVYSLFGRGEDVSEVFITVDESLSIVELSEGARKAFGEDLCHFSIRKYVPEADSHRLEGFISGDKKAKDIHEIGISLLDLKGFRFARVRQSGVFGSFLWRIYLFRSQKEYITSVHKRHAQLEISREFEGLFDSSDRIRELIAATERSASSSDLSRMFSDFCCRVASATLLQNVSCEQTCPSSFDVCAVIDMALKNISESERCSFSEELQQRRIASLTISAEELIYLVTALYCSTRECLPSFYADLSEDGSLNIVLKGDCRAICRQDVCVGDCHVLPLGISFTDLDGLYSEGSSFCLYLCDLICMKGDLPTTVKVGDGRLHISVSIPPVSDVPEFKSRELCDISPIHLRLCSTALVNRISERRKAVQE